MTIRHLSLAVGLSVIVGRAACHGRGGTPVMGGEGSLSLWGRAACHGRDCPDAVAWYGDLSLAAADAGHAMACQSTAFIIASW